MQKILGNFDFKQLDSPDFKEDSVREVIILPILHKLGFSNSNSNAKIERSKTLPHPFVNVGSQKRKINLYPDYLLKVEDKYAWALDAKAPNQEIRFGDNVEQIFSYAIHPEVRTAFFALCNGKSFIVFKQDESQPVLYFEMADLENNWEKLSVLLSSDSFQSGKKFTYVAEGKNEYGKSFDYMNQPLLEELPVKKQEAKRHFGVHGYFTKQSWNIVHDYIKNFSQKGDLVLDPFGGSGVTAIEALMSERRAIHVDLNPMSISIVNGLIAPVKINDLQLSFAKVKENYLAREPKTEEEIQKALKKYPYPKGIVWRLILQKE